MYMRARVRFPRLATILVSALLPLACSSGDPQKPGPPEPDFEPALFFSPGRYCVKGTSGADTLLVLNQGKAELVWRPIGVPDWVQGLGDEVRLDPDEAEVIRWTWSSRPQAPFSDTVVAVTNDPDHETVRIVLEDVLATPPAYPPPTPLLAFPPDSAHFSVGDTIFVAWQDFDVCSPVEYRLQISLNATFTQVVCCQDFGTAPAVEVIVDRGDEGRAWWRVVPRWVGGATGLPSRSRTWLVE
jgi:hypothetical protein